MCESHIVPRYTHTSCQRLFILFETRKKHVVAPPTQQYQRGKRTVLATEKLEANTAQERRRKQKQNHARPLSVALDDTVRPVKKSRR